MRTKSLPSKRSAEPNSQPLIQLGSWSSTPAVEPSVPWLPWPERSWTTWPLPSYIGHQAATESRTPADAVAGTARPTASAPAAQTRAMAGRKVRRRIRDMDELSPGVLASPTGRKSRVHAGARRTPWGKRTRGTARGGTGPPRAAVVTPLHRDAAGGRPAWQGHGRP